MAARPRRKAPSATEAAADSGATAILALDGALDLDAAAPLRMALLARRGSDLAVDASSVRHLGGLCAQVLASAAATWARDGRSIEFRAPSEAFTHGVDLLGLGSILNIGA